MGGNNKSVFILMYMLLIYSPHFYFLFSNKIRLEYFNHEIQNIFCEKKNIVENS